MTSVKPRVAILHYAAPPTIGGVESTIAAHARLLADHHYEVKIVAGRGEVFDPRVPVEIIADANSQSPRVLEVNAELARGIVTEKFHALADDLTRALESSLTHWNKVIVHNVLSLHKNLALTSALRRMAEANQRGLVAWCHDFAWNDPQYAADVHPGAPWELLRQPWKSVQYVVVSEDRRKELQAIWNAEGEISVVPPGIDPYEFLGVSLQAARWSRELALLEAAPLLLLPARITRRKNIERAIEITAALVSLGLRPKLLVTGPPGAHNPANAAYLDRLRALRRSLSVEKEVVFLHEYGRVQGAQLRDLYLLCDAMLFPSEREGFGIPLLEAGVARLPVFCADLPPFRETARDDAHFFSPAASPAATAAEIAAYFQNDSVYQLKKRVVSHYAWESIFTQRIEPLLTGT